ncbi:hypothetical protein DYB32_000764 [Aphanomyces invadans]|uniref:Uncharacterized protein n=1 Tax=Aphanomyces invadans TaxID=157072 RepID=A0A3R6W3W2_9STRA|nr:hypothetical protein DYB32_000764 [Aphanomyces invadans]
MGISLDPRFDCEDDDDDDNYDESDSCEEGEIDFHPSDGMQGQMPIWALSDCPDTPHLSLREANREDGSVDVTPAINITQAPFFLHPLSPDCLSPQTQFNRILGPGAPVSSFEPRPPARRRHSFTAKSRPVPALPLVRRIGHHVPPTSNNVHAAIFSDESDDENDMHNTTLSSISSDLNFHDLDGDGHTDQIEDEPPSSGQQTTIPQLLLPHLVALGFDASITLSALQTSYGHYQTQSRDNNRSDGENLDEHVLLFAELVKCVVDRHHGTAPVDNQGVAEPESRASLPTTHTTLHKLQHIMQPIQPDTTFPWPVFDMVRVARFLSSANRQQATLAARTLDGFRWSLTEPPIRSMLFREYHGSTSNVKDGQDDTNDMTLHAMDLISEADDDGDDGAGPDNQHHHTHHLTQRNEQLEYLIHYVEQDRDAILLENEDLKCMLDKYRMREHEQEEALHSLTGLRKRIQVNELKYREHVRRMRENERVIESLQRRMNELTGSVVRVANGILMAR